MYQGPVPKEGKDHEEIRRIWNEEVPNPDPNATEEADDSDRQEPRATGNVPFCTSKRPILLKFVLFVLSSAFPGTPRNPGSSLWLPG